MHDYTCGFFMFDHLCPPTTIVWKVKPSTHIKWQIPQSHFRCNLPIRVFQCYFVWCVNSNGCQCGIAQQLFHPPSATISFWNTLNWSRILLLRCFGFIKDERMFNTISFMKIDYRIGLACSWICAIDFTINIFSSCNFFHMNKGIIKWLGKVQACVHA
jgi:hypothetical protein